MTQQAEPSLDKILQDFLQRSEASYVIIAATILDDWLETALTSQMRMNLSTTVQSRLFEGYGPLSSFSAKIDVAYAFKVIDDDAFADFRAIKDLRNAFAHTSKILYFESPELRPLFQKLTGWSENVKPRELFHARYKACVECLDRFVETSTYVQALQKHAITAAAGSQRAQEASAGQNKMRG